MTDNDELPSERKQCAAALAHWLTEARELRLAAHADPIRAPRRKRLRVFQAARLAATHADLRASARYEHAANFFLTDLYSPKDLCARDAEIERVLPAMTNLLPLKGLRALLLAGEADALSERFDLAMVDAMGDRLDGSFTEGNYTDAYRQVGDREGRERQIELIRATGETLDGLAHKPALRTLLRSMRRPAQLAGLGELQGFLERGLNAFRSMRSAEEFLDIVVGREAELADSLFRGARRVTIGEAARRSA